MTERDDQRDRYRPRRVLGEGAVGRVWLVDDRARPDRPLAMKELAAAAADRPGQEERLRREFALLAALRHPAIVEVHEFGDAGTRFTQEFIQGRNIVDAVRADGPGAVTALAAEALRGLAFLHDFHLLHRDIKPDNVLVRDRAKLGCHLVFVDFGLALHAAEAEGERGEPKGTLPYMAPELFEGGVAGPRSDLYALGAVLFEAVHGAPPILPSDRGLAAFIERVRHGRRKRPALPPGFPAGLDRWLEEMLAPDRRDRPANAAVALARLNERCGSEWPLETAVTRSARLRSGPPAERAGELATVWDALDPIGGPRIVWLTGPEGSGKSRLLRWLEADAMLHGWDVVAPQAGTLVPAVDDLRRRAQAGPTLLIVDQADGADAGVAAVLERIGRDRTGAAVQVVAAVRPTGIRDPSLRRLFSDTGTVPTLRRVDLPPLSDEGTRAMAERAVGVPVADARVRWLIERAEGSPSRTEALLISQAWERGPAADDDHPDFALSNVRLGMLGSDSRRWITALAVLETDAEPDRVAALAGLEPDVARAAGDEAAAAGLAVPRGGRWSVESRAAASGILARVPRHVVRGLSREAVRTLAGTPAAPWTLARLHHRAGDRRAAVRFAMEAATVARGAGDPSTAEARYRQALLWMERRDPRRPGVRMRQAEAAMDAGAFRSAARAFGAAVRLSRDPSGIADARVGQAHALILAGRFRRAMTAADQALEAAHRARDPALRSRALQVSGIVLGRTGQERRAIPVLRDAHRLLGPSPDPRAEADLLHTLATLEMRLEDPRAAASFRAAIGRYRRLRRGTESSAEVQELKARLGLAVLRLRAGRVERASHTLRYVRDVAREHGHLDVEQAAISRLAALATDDGRLDVAIDLAEQAADLARYLGDANILWIARCRVADARVRSGRASGAVRLLRDALRRRHDGVEPENVDYARMLLAHALMDAGDGEDAEIETILARCLDGCRGRPQRRALLMALAIEMERRSRPDASGSIAPVADEYDALVASSDAPPDAEIRFRAAVARAAAALRDGDPVRARAHGADAAEIARDAGAPGFGARAMAVVAEAARRAGDVPGERAAREAGRERLRDATDRIVDDDVRESFRARAVFAPLLRADDGGSAEAARLRTLYDMIRAVNSAEDPERLLETILDMALRAVGAERGLILLREDPDDDAGFEVRVVRDLDQDTARDALSYSRGIVEEAGAGRSLLAVDAGADDRFRDLRSVSLYGIRSLMCVPLRSKGRIVGTVYLDSRTGRRMFDEDDLQFVEAFADHAALALANARTRAALEEENRRLREAAQTRTEFANLIGRSEGMQRVFDAIPKYASSALPVLIVGESGTGKELVARAVHDHGPRRDRAFLSVNCAAIPDSLLESELFGHVRGAFTGAERDRPGLFEQADGGTLFLDEVGDMPAAMQSDLLRVLETGELRRVGGERTVHVDVRIVAATHRDLQDEVRAGRFRLDLFYRLQVLTVELPPLRDRPGDLRLLVERFLDRIGAEQGSPAPTIDDEALGTLARHPWPGNVRELENAVQRLALMGGPGGIRLDTLASDPVLGPGLVESDGAVRSALSLDRGEADQLRRALEASGGDRREAARLLGVSRATIYRKIKKHGL